jgi:ppGpp synthetase/RelA/SpoT-type nucleotidyltranferase
MKHPAEPELLVDLLDRMLPEPIRSEEGFARWFEPWRRRITVAVTEVHGAVHARLDEEKRRVYQQEAVFRPVWQVTGTDGSSLLKSAASVRSKLGREIRSRVQKKALMEARLSLEQVERLLLDFPDLGRFRVLCDYTSDVERARKVLMTRNPPALLGRYPVADRVKDYVRDLSLRHPARGHRAVQLAVRVPPQNLLVEIQLMTLLQNAWDCRNHPLYEWSREGGSLPADLTLLDVALAESLYLLDHQATQNFRTFLRLKKKNGGAS